jgi:class 3 adenylate cyclase
MTKTIDATILFVDVMDSMEIANYWDTKKYRNFLNEFQETMQDGICLHKDGIKDFKIAGDETVVFYSSKDIGKDIVNAVCLANTLKILWYTRPTNRRRISDGKKVLDLGIGINTGKITYGEMPVYNELKKFIKRKKTFEGLPISLAKRIEGFSRDGRYSRIMVGPRTMTELNKQHHAYECEFMGLQKFKGMSQETPVFELKSCYSTDAAILGGDKGFDWAIKQLERIKVFDPSNIWLLMTLIDIYCYKKNYKKVEIYCKEAVGIDDKVRNILFELASSLEEQKKYDEAIFYCDKGINSWMDYTGFYMIKAACLIFLERYDDAIKTCINGINNFPKECTICRRTYGSALYYNIAAAHARKGDRARALANIRTAIKYGGRELIEILKKDKDGDFCNLYGDNEFKQLKEGILKKNNRRRKN